MTNLSLKLKALQNLFLVISCFSIMVFTSCQKENKDTSPVLKEMVSVSTVIEGLHSPMGLEKDEKGRLWVVEGGTGKCDGTVSIIIDGKIYPVITDFASNIFENGDVNGPTHLIFIDKCLYILAPKGKMYKAQVADFKPGDAPVKASSLAFEDIGTFVLAYNFVNNAHDSHPYNLTAGPDEAIYITDAGANAIIRRAKNGALSVVAEVPGVNNPLPFGPPVVQSVPTGIIWDGNNFLVTTLLGFPFPQGKAIIYKISLTGAVSIYQDGFTTLVDIAQGNTNGHLVLEHGSFGATGFVPNTGRLVWANGLTATELKGGLNIPVGIKQTDEHTWYVTSLGDGSILKVTE